MGYFTFLSLCISFQNVHIHKWSFIEETGSILFSVYHFISVYDVSNLLHSQDKHLISSGKLLTFLWTLLYTEVICRKANKCWADV